MQIKWRKLRRGLWVSGDSRMVIMRTFTRGEGGYDEIVYSVSINGVEMSKLCDGLEQAKEYALKCWLHRTEPQK